jgi:hypothetical protein
MSVPIFKEPTKLVAVVIAHTNRTELTPTEEISLRHLRRYLGDYDKFLLIPESLDFELDGLVSKHFSDDFFGSIENHKKMIFSKEYYHAFDDYKYMLTYHLDALVFSNQLKEWCQKDYDYIGPPWIKHEDSPNAGTIYEGRVGNSGFCLKKISTFLEVLYSEKFAFNPDEYWENNYKNKPLLTRIRNLPKKYRMRSHKYNNIGMELLNWGRSEERFILERLPYYYPEFRVPDVQEALKFGFETLPRHCFDINNSQLPFGCHAWERYDKAFWEPYLLK